MIKVSNVSLEIKRKIILDNINIYVKSGEICGLVGRNGCGKTMLMKCICGLTYVSSGEIIVNNQKIGKDIDFPQNMGLIIETPGFIDYMSGYKNLLYLSKYRGIIGAGEIKKIMIKVGLDPELRLPVKKYSLGMKQRLGIAQAIMENPSILIFDEPFNSLDIEGVMEIRELLLEYKKQGKCILIASHNNEDISLLCDRVYCMEKGRIVSEKNIE